MGANHKGLLASDKPSSYHAKRRSDHHRRHRMLPWVIGVAVIVGLWLLFGPPLASEPSASAFDDVRDPPRRPTTARFKPADTAASSDKVATPGLASAVAAGLQAISPTQGIGNPSLAEVTQSKQPTSTNARKLGFDEIYVINLKKRTDRKAQMLLQADFLGLQFKFTEAATPETMGYIPKHKKRLKGMSEFQLACWRSHMNIYLDIVERNLTSALILEDDVDLDLTLPRDIPRALAKLPANDWDVFYVGHCGPYEDKSTVFDGDLGINRPYEPYCLHGYAVSRRGARRLLHKLSNAATAIDFHVIGLKNTRQIAVYSFQPPRIVQRRDEDNPSDIPQSKPILASQTLQHSTVKAYSNWVKEDRPKDYYFRNLVKSYPQRH
ncbi:hypothetical protein H4R34_003483 [Dimargaris verticillata]|uniref:Glycosyl transferase family 25 domain-containing protein n=1 Tax=Dimargaris verticillata TaxID=2761393 RepID=A0A9W8AZY0_9FUNG|nr:hypothetical protein H4R34_003483 [Dimargaris verticillata]